MLAISLTAPEIAAFTKQHKIDYPNHGTFRRSRCHSLAQTEKSPTRMLLHAQTEEATMRLTESALALCTLICMATQAANSKPGDDDINVLPPLSHTFFCLRYPDDCARTDSTAALPASLDGRWRKMNLVNDSVNAAIAPKAKPDRLHAHWAIGPLEGDCNDFSVTKRHELLNAGWPSSSLLLAEVRLISTGEHHLILIVTGLGTDWVLDNLKGDIVRLAATRNEYAIVRIESSENPRYWTRQASQRRRGRAPGGF
jgi:predicted transglutaminase-like cysteine proteinase